MTSRKAEWGYIWRNGDIYGGMGMEFNVIGDSLGIKLAEWLFFVSIIYTKKFSKSGFRTFQVERWSQILQGAEDQCATSAMGRINRYRRCVVRA